MQWGGDAVVFSLITAAFSAFQIIGGLVLGLGFMLLDTRLDSTVFAAAVLIAIGNGLMWPLLVALLSEKAGD
jgi:hypothetical protein